MITSIETYSEWRKSQLGAYGLLGEGAAQVGAAVFAATLAYWMNSKVVEKVGLHPQSAMNIARDMHKELDRLDNKKKMFIFKNRKLEFELNRIEGNLDALDEDLKENGQLNVSQAKKLVSIIKWEIKALRKGDKGTFGKYWGRLEGMLGKADK